MSTADILEVTLSQLSVDYTGTRHQNLNGILSVTWHYPCEDINSVSTTLAVQPINEQEELDYRQHSYLERALFKHNRRGTSSFSIELAVIKDPSLIGHIFNLLSNTQIIVNSQLGGGISAIMNTLNLNQQKAKRIAVGTFQLEAHEANFEAAIPLITPEKLYCYNDDNAEDFFLDDSDTDEEVEIIPAQSANGAVHLQINQL